MISAENDLVSSNLSSRYWVERAQSQIGLDPEYEGQRESESKNTLRRLLSLARHPILNKWVIEGISTTLDRYIKLVVVDDGRELPYILKLTGLSEAKRTRIGTVSAFRIPDLPLDYDIAITISNRLLSDRYTCAGYSVLPAWIRLFHPLINDPSKSIHTYGKWAKRDLRKIQNGDFTYEIVTDDWWVDEFYDKMYVPHAKLRHGDTALIRSKRRIRWFFNNGHMMVLRKNGILVGACLMVPKGQVLMWPYMGIVDCDPDTLKEGRAIALYWFVMQWAYNNGFKSIDYGHCRPFLTDGVLRYKLKWNMRVVDDDDAVRDIAIKVNPQSSAGMAFLVQNPFIYLDNGKLAISEIEDPGLEQDTDPL